MKLVTAEQMRALEQAAVDAGTSLDELMEQAGLAVAQEVWLTLGVVAERRVLVLAGPGNNGGDGIVAARHLADWDAGVVVYVAAQRPHDGPQLEQLRQRDVAVIDASDDAGFTRLEAALERAEMVIDALLGTGHARPIEGAMAEVLRRLAARRALPAAPQLIAVDLPTGVNADTGAADPLAVHADSTITFGLAKVGLHVLPGAEHAGRVQVIDIGLPEVSQRDLPFELLDARWVRERLPARAESANKGTFGKVMVVAGSEQYVGAARLACEAAYRAGAGLVTLACPRAVQAMVAPALAEATYLPLDGDTGALQPTHSGIVLDALSSYDALLIGPGLSQAPGVAEAAIGILEGLPDSMRACVIDGDALNALAATPGWHERVPSRSVLTPHPGEMARLTGAGVAEVQADRLSVALSAARQWQQVVALKGAHTVVAAPDGRALISPYANPLLATAGTGDVLAGAIAGLVAQGADAFDAAGCGVYLHALAADEIAEDVGDRGMLAGDLLPALPRAIRTVLHGRRVPPRHAPGALPDFAAMAGLRDSGQAGP